MTMDWKTKLWLDVVSADECLGLSTYPDPVRAEQSNLADCPPQILVVPYAAHLGQGGQDAAVPGVDDTPTVQYSTVQWLWQCQKCAECSRRELWP